MNNILHDETDAIEELEEKAREVVSKVKAQTLGIAKSNEDMRSFLEEIVLRVADGLADVTTEAAMTGFAFGRKKAEKANAGDS